MSDPIKITYDSLSRADVEHALRKAYLAGVAEGLRRTTVMLARANQIMVDHGAMGGPEDVAGALQGIARMAHEPVEPPQIIVREAA
jgi:hypothetical protein